MKAAGWGRIIFISSESTVTKTMQLALSRGLAETTSGTGMTVKFVQNIAKAKQITAGDFEIDFFRTVRPSSILQRIATPDEVAARVVFAASPLSSAGNGAALPLDGGTVRSIL